MPHVFAMPRCHYRFYGQQQVSPRQRHIIISISAIFDAILFRYFLRQRYVDFHFIFCHASRRFRFHACRRYVFRRHFRCCFAAMMLLFYWAGTLHYTVIFCRNVVTTTPANKRNTTRTPIIYAAADYCILRLISRLITPSFHAATSELLARQ